MLNNYRQTFRKKQFSKLKIFTTSIEQNNIDKHLYYYIRGKRKLWNA